MMRKIAIVVLLGLCVGYFGCKQAPKNLALGTTSWAFFESQNDVAIKGEAVGAGPIVGALAADSLQTMEMNDETNGLKSRLAAKEKALQAGEADKITLRAEINALKKQIADLIAN